MDPRPASLSRAGVAARVLATVVGLALLVGGTFWGSDDDFPFAPFRMYAGVNPPDEDAPDPRVEGTLATGAATPLGQNETGIRRAEVEAKQDQYVAQPALLAEIADAYARRHPGAPRVVEVRLVMRWHEIQDSRPTGEHRDEVLAVWRAR
ncbi:hypothetical protein GCM10022251_16290 [Phytohabitans flavus]|uniref:Uncharacterized protein n=1 Tax=Phytohabitans flavus TaxID=1076124 RepID=A0A6F8Y675_9ACTN|nr:hypothetical protein [Phytohabitans flavus]BCB81622.1 hypothetical protein Pflav_080320 [Phytohabitans flavus]